MKRRLAAALLVVAGVLLLIATPVQAEPQEIEVVQVAANRFPRVSLTVAVPGHDPESIDESRLTVTENGTELDATVEPIAPVGFDIALLLDVSASMKETALVEAKEAAAQFVTALPGDADILLVSFATEVRLETPLTNDHAQVLEGIDALEIRDGTALYDAVDLALDSLGPAHGARQMLVTLSDGADTESEISPEELAARIIQRDVQFAGVGLETNEGETAQLDALAAEVGGRSLSTNDPKGLSAEYNRIAESLTSLVEVTYTATRGLESPEVVVHLDGPDGPSAEVVYPGLVDPTALALSAPPVRSGGSVGLLGQPWVPWIAALLFASGVIGSVLLVQQEDPRKALNEVLTGFDENPYPDDPFKSESGIATNPTELLSGIADGITDVTSRVLEKDGRAERIDQGLEQAGVSLRAGELGAFVATATFAGLALGYLLGGWGMAIMGAIAPAALTPLVLRFMRSRRRKKFADQLGDTLMLISGALKAGYGLGQAIDSVASEAPTPTCEEFSRVLLETRLGMGIEEALVGVSERMESEDFEWVVNAVKINATVGGDLSGILDQVGDTIRARNRIRRQIAALAAEGKISALVLFCLPPGLVAFISMSNPDYVAPLFNTSTGNGILGAALVLMLMGGAWLKKIVNPEI